MESIIGRKEENVMANLYEDIICQLKIGADVKCPKCEKGIIKPYNAPPEKAHTFNCTVCDFNVHFDPVVIVE